MTDAAPEPLKGLKTWAYLAEKRKRPSEYEIVSTNLHYRNTNTEGPWEQSPDSFMNKWYRQYCYDSPLEHEDWDAFRDPDEIIYRTYNIMQDGQETAVKSMFEQFAAREQDKALSAEWVATLAKLYTPCRYLYHTAQMGSAYLQQMAPSSTITNCGAFQTADCLRWLTHTAYRTRELANNHPGAGFGENERQLWENDPAWQGFRELMEKALIAWDFGEAFTAICLVAKPAIEEATMSQLGSAARANGDTLLGMLTQAQMLDVGRHRRWTSALVAMALEVEGNDAVLKGWLDKWVPLADQAIDAYCAALSDASADDAKKAAQSFRSSLGL